MATEEKLDGDLPAAGINISITDRLMGFDSNSDTYFFTPDEISAGTGWLEVYMSGDTTVQVADNNTLFIRKTSTATLTLQDTSVYPDDFRIAVKNDINNNTQTLFVECDASDTINFGPNKIGLGQNNSVALIKDAASNWATIFSSGQCGNFFPPLNINANIYTLALKDAGVPIYFPANADAKTLTLPANAVVDIPQGQSFIAHNPGSVAVTISSADTIVGATSIPAGAAAFIFKEVYGAPNTWVALLLQTQSIADYLKASNNLSDVANLSTAQANMQITGLQTIYVPSSAMYATVTNPASLVQTETSTNKNQTRAFSFSDSATTNVGFRVSMPKRWDGSAIGFRVFWKTPGTSGNALWQIKAVIRNDGSVDDLAFGTTTQTADNAQASASATSITTAFATVTPAGTASTNAEIEFIVFRDPSNVSDTLNSAAIITGILLFYESDRGNDDLI
jgi:hypothetical protein